ncbi:MAG TPA: acetyl-CoA carboxylase biotin carboxyl carrier protein [Oligoflexia bacterium]|nr:acetyl-CoA carboxylase biotin carboxyl carrier protein [Oligoflexia bacterium]HMP48645.1 acetyl-CoA carboxylase biotin carboxyl carrier protein [Oligoflexia bacterium]
MANHKKQIKSEAESMKEDSRSDSLLGLREIEILLETLEKHEVTEFKLERENEKVWLKRGPQASAPNYMIPAFHAPQYPYSAGVPSAGYPVQVAGTNVPDSQLPHSAGPVASPVSIVGGSPSGSPLSGAGTQSGKNIKEIRSPMVGTFYRRPAVDADPYVKVGDTVKKGDVLCIVEAMKLMNEIESEVGGKILEICLEDGQMVEFGEVLYRIELP